MSADGYAHDDGRGAEINVEGRTAGKLMPRFEDIEITGDPEPGSPDSRWVCDLCDHEETDIGEMHYHLVQHRGDDVTDVADDDWHDIAQELHEKGGVPESRAEAIALVAIGYTYDEAADRMGLEGDSRRSQVGQHVRRYRSDDLENAKKAQWLAHLGPDV